MTTQSRHHINALIRALYRLEADEPRLIRWAGLAADRLRDGGRLLAAGNGGSAAQAQHLVAELVGKLDHDRPPLSAIALSAETCGLTAIGNDYGFDRVFSRQVTAHTRPGDVVVLMSTSGRSPNVVAAAEAARAAGAQVWAMTGTAPNPLSMACDDTFAVPAADTQVIQEVHLTAVHLLCAHVDAVLDGFRAGAPQPVSPVGAPV
jgi:D-sedoheptulose 7-phosphate isomerase